MLNPRWRKVLRDFQQNNGRMSLVVGAIGLGIFSVTWVSVAYSILTRELNDNYLATNPASAIIYTDNANLQFIQAIDVLPDIAEVEATGSITARIWVNEEWKTLDLFIRQDFENTKVNQVTPEKGTYPPLEGEILLERLALAVADVEIGDNIQIQIPGYPEQSLRVAGTLHDLNLAPAWQESTVYGYVTPATLTKLGIVLTLNEIRIVVTGNRSDTEYIRSVALQTAEWLEAQGQPVYRVQVPPPNEHPTQGQMEGGLLLLTAFGTMALLLSAVLVANMFAALLAGQLRQIAVMKAIGARQRQLMGMYIGMVLLMSSLAAVVAIPLGIVVGRFIADFIAFMLNFKIESYQIPYPVFVLQLFVGLCVPIGAAAYPIYKGTRQTVQETLTNYGVEQNVFGESWVDQIFARLNGLTRPLLLSIRNTFRRRGRLLLTFSTLAVGGAMFIIALNVRASLMNTIKLKYEGLNYDLSLSFDQPYPVDLLENTAATIEGVTTSESWGRSSAAIIDSNGTAGNAFILLAPPSQTKLIEPALMEGEWLPQPNGIVLNHTLIAEYPSIKVGDTITLSLNNQTSTWEVLGIVRDPVSPPLAYVSYEDFANITHQVGYAQSLYLVTDQQDESSLEIIKQRLEQGFAENNIVIASNQTSFNTRQIIENHVTLITSFLMMATFMSVVVGGLGLIITMSINVLERTREIGVMRAIGASSKALLRIILIEGVLIGILSWGGAALIALPLSYVVAQALGNTMLETSLDFTLSPIAFAIWLGLVVIFSVVASLIPARNAIRLTVRDVLAYE